MLDTAVDKVNHTASRWELVVVTTASAAKLIPVTFYVTESHSDHGDQSEAGGNELEPWSNESFEYSPLLVLKMLFIARSQSMSEEKDATWLDVIAFLDGMFVH